MNLFFYNATVNWRNFQLTIQYKGDLKPKKIIKFVNLRYPIKYKHDKNRICHF